MNINMLIYNIINDKLFEIKEQIPLTFNINIRIRVNYELVVFNGIISSFWEANLLTNTMHFKLKKIISKYKKEIDKINKRIFI